MKNFLLAYWKQKYGSTDVGTLPNHLWGRVFIATIVAVTALADFIAWIGGFIVGVMFITALFMGSAHFSSGSSEKQHTEFTVSAPHAVHSD